MNNIDLQIENYNKNDMLNFIQLKSNYNYFDLQNKINLKISQINNINSISNKQKEELVKFVQLIHYKLKDKLNYDDKSNDSSHKNLYNNEYKLDHINLHLKEIKNDLIQRKLSEKDTVFVSPVNQGTVNPLTNNIITTQVSIDTKFRKDYFNSSSTNFTVNLATPLKNVISMKLASLEIPNVQHMISQSNGTNSFFVKKELDSGINVAPEKTVNIPSGNYDSDTIIIAINKELSEIKCFIDIDTTTMRTTISNSNQTKNFELDFSNTVINNAPPMKSLGWLLGFRNKKYEGHNSYVSEATADLGGIKYFFLCVDDFKNTRQEVCTILYENSFLRKNILARIPMREGKGAILFDDQSDQITKKRQYFGTVNIDKLQLSLIDEYGTIIDLNGNDYSLALEFDILYEK